MHVTTPLPHLMFVDVLTPAGPYEAGDRLSVAFAASTVGRLALHGHARAADGGDGAALVPETMTVRVTRSGGPYELNCLLTLAFIDPSIARIHASAGDAPPHAIRSDALLCNAPRNVSTNGAPLPQSATHTGAVGPTISDQTAAQTSALTFARASAQMLRSDEPRAANATARDEAVAGHEATATSEAAAQEFDDVSDVAPRGGVAVAAASAGVRTPQIRDGIHAGRPPENLVEAFGASARAGSECAAPASSNGITKPTPESALLTPLDVLTSGPVSSHVSARKAAPIHIRLEWTPDRARRFVQLVDKLFTVDRLGWYRHALAMRLLVPDDITCASPARTAEAMLHLRALRAAAVETLGRPLLTAFMPNFVVTPQWLESLDSSAAARALAGLRDAIEPRATEAVDEFADVDAHPGPAWTIDSVSAGDLAHAHATNVEALVPVLIATTSTMQPLTDRLRDYRTALLDAFRQTARSAEPVRLNRMTEANHALDDRLWQLVGTVGESFDGLAVA